MGSSPRGHKESDSTERLTLSLSKGLVMWVNYLQTLLLFLL